MGAPVAALGSVRTLGGVPGKLAYLPTFLVNSNRALLLGFLRFAFGKQTVLWDRAERR